MMKLSELVLGVDGCEVHGDPNCLIFGLCAHSKELKSGDLFFVKKGKVHNGEDFIPQAIQQGVAALCVSRYYPQFFSLPQVVCPDVSQIEAELADRFYGSPSQKLTLVAVTGTSGKTTTSFLIKQLLEGVFGTPCGLMGTIENIIGLRRVKATHTTPDVVTNHRMLREMSDAGCHMAVMEATSHALVQGRLEKVDFDVALFSNLSHDHLDYHESMDHYAAAKKKLFDALGSEKKGKKKKAIINNDDPWASFMISDCRASLFSYGIETSADLQATEIRYFEDKTEMTLLYKDCHFMCTVPLVGKFNVYNTLAAISVVLTQGVSLETIVPHAATLVPARGRLERVSNKRSLSIFVDYAHKPDALFNVLVTLKKMIKDRGRLILVFGCGGDRDREKRAQMGSIAENHADWVIVTSDNPRSEDPLSICQGIEKGFTVNKKYCIELDRRAAIKKAIEMATLEDIVLIAGKGHETGQIFASGTKAFDDREEVLSICESLP